MRPHLIDFGNEGRAQRTQHLGALLLAPRDGEHEGRHAERVRDVRTHRVDVQHGDALVAALEHCVMQQRAALRVHPAALALAHRRQQLAQLVRVAPADRLDARGDC